MWKALLLDQIVKPPAPTVNPNKATGLCTFHDSNINTPSVCGDANMLKSMRQARSVALVTGDIWA